ncbi:MAG: GAF domain-containing protein, partial [Deltaproteobacteria bacterium]|nr:GAF domain-containing protein [Deltaproteobacteria bacterium]
ERFEAQRRLAKNLSGTMEANEILEKLREETRALVPEAMEVCVLLLDSDAHKYTRPLQCALFATPVNCLSFKKSRVAVQKALARNKGVVISRSEPIVRQDGSLVETGPEAAMPIYAGDEVVGVLHVVIKPGSRFTSRDFYFMKDLAEMAGNVILNAKRHWEVTQEKIRINQMLVHLSPFVPRSVRRLVEEDPEMLNKEKELREVTVLFLDLEGYTRLSTRLSEVEVNEVIEKMFSSFVDPIHRSGGDINETAGDGLMIIFKNEDAEGNAVSAVRAAFDIYDRNRRFSPEIKGESAPINVNIGINSGSALLGMTRFEGSLGTRMTYTASGPVTNLAARLADHAEGGDILVGEETRRLIKDIWPVYEKGNVLLKGMEEPVNVYSLFSTETNGNIE